jgi:biopolymer transport protein ExbD
MRRPLARPASIRTFDMTPMIDVVLQLIIFFMFTSQFGQVTRSEVELPRERGEEEEAAADRPTLVIDISSEGVFLVEARPMPLERVVGLVGAEVARSGGRADRVDLLIRADRRATATRLNQLANALSEIGVRRWSLGTSSVERGDP